MQLAWHFQCKADNCTGQGKVYGYNCGNCILALNGLGLWYLSECVLCLATRPIHSLQSKMWKTVTPKAYEKSEQQELPGGFFSCGPTSLE